MAQTSTGPSLSVSKSRSQLFCCKSIDKLMGKVRDAMLDYDRRRLALAHANRQQLDPWLRLPKSSGQVQSTPTKHLIGIHAVRPRATRATDAPGASVSSTIRRFSAILRRCRCAAAEPSLSLEVTVACWEVSISAGGVKKSRNRSVATRHTVMTYN